MRTSASSGRNQPVLHQLFTLLFVHVGIHARLGIPQEHDFERAEDAGLGPGPEQSDRELAARQVLLDQHGLAELAQQLLADTRQLLAIR